MDASPEWLRQEGAEKAGEYGYLPVVDELCFLHFGFPFVLAVLLFPFPFTTVRFKLLTVLLLFLGPLFFRLFAGDGLGNFGRDKSPSGNSGKIQFGCEFKSFDSGRQNGQPLSPPFYHIRRRGDKGGDIMKQSEKAIGKALGEAIKVLPPEKKEYLAGFAEGVAAMARRQEEKEE